MQIKNIGEFGLINKLAALLPKSKDVIIGIGDDAAVLPYNKDSYLLLTTDMMAQGVHFDLTMPARRIGQKALNCNVSDIVAMGGVPKSAVISLGLPKTTSVAWVQEIYKGVADAAKVFDVNIVGGDTIASKEVVINIALLGEVKKKYLVPRSGAKPGDMIFVTGPLGGSLKSGRHLSFTPRLPQAQFLVKNFKPSSMMDISDGLAGDLNHILEQSRVGVQLWERCIPRHAGASLSQALTDGEDYELLFTLNQKQTKDLEQWQLKNKAFYFYGIGEITKNPKQRVNAKGFTHF